METPDVPENESEYHSSSDEDFNPEDDGPDQEEVSSSEDETSAGIAQPSVAQRRRKRRTLSEDGLDSGDEVTIQERRRAKRRKHKGKTLDADDDGVVIFSDNEGGEGGLVKTRSQRMREEKERRPLATTKGATVDVDSIWARLISAPVTRDIGAETRAHQQQNGQPRDEQGTASGGVASAKLLEEEEEFITIKRTYRFAGEVQTEERRVAKSSEEARLYLAEQEKVLKRTEAGKDGTAAEDGEDDVERAAPPEEKPMRRPRKRPSRFEPNPLGEVKGLPPEHQLRWPRGAAPLRAGDANAVAALAASRLGSGNKPVKLNTVEKSRYDWVQFVDKEGISEELDEYGRAKESYLGRMEFLGRTEDKREGERRRVRLGGSVAVGNGVGSGP